MSTTARSDAAVCAGWSAAAASSPIAATLVNSVTRLAPMYESGPYRTRTPGTAAAAVSTVATTLDDVHVTVGSVAAAAALADSDVLM